MAEHSAIEWTDATWNPVTGCSVVSPGCTNCYAMRLAGSRLRAHPSRAGLTRDSKAGPVWTGEVRLNAEWLDQPLRWRRPRRIFVCAHGDLFHEAVPDAWIDQVFAVMALAQQHSFQVLTKRAARMRGYFLGRAALLRIDRIVKDMATRQPTISPDGKLSWPLRNVWLGVSAEDQRRADERIPDLLATPAAVRFVSLEPLLGAIDLEPWLEWGDCSGFVGEKPWGCQECDTWCPECPRRKAAYHCDEGPRDADGMPAGIACDRVTLDWVIVGGESGPGARPMHPAWARGLRDQCAAAGVPLFFKQWGSWLDADQLMARIESGSAFIALDGERWQPLRPLNFADAEILARTIGRGFLHDSDGTTSLRMDKHAAGRLLDGVEHNGMPAVAEASARQAGGVAA